MLKIRDKVKVIKDDYSTMNRTGDIGVIYDIDNLEGVPLYHIDFGEQFFRYGRFHSWELQKIKG